MISFSIILLMIVIAILDNVFEFKVKSVEDIYHTNLKGGGWEQRASGRNQRRPFWNYRSSMHESQLGSTNTGQWKDKIWPLMIFMAFCLRTKDELRKLLVSFTCA